jgi:uncharacterized protein YjbI with pentapeptide repeats
MATTDLFNNPSNDYVNPGLSPCAGASDDAYFGIGDGNAEITSGSDILAKLDFSDIQIPVSAYSTETKILEEGEVVYIPGLTKGLQKRKQVFFMPNLVSTDEDLNPYFLTVDLSLSYYKNFKYVQVAIDASANYGQNISLEDALNIALDGISVTATYDPSTLSFTGTVDGFDFTVSNVILGVIDASQNVDSPFPNEANAETYGLVEDPDSEVCYAKYPNGASQGIVMKGIYPSSTPMTPYDHWLYINHVSDYVTFYEPIEIDNYVADVSSYLRVGYDPSTYFGKVEPSLNLDFDIPDSSSNLYDVSLLSFVVSDVSTDPTDASISYDTSTFVIDGSTIEWKEIYDCSISNSVISNSNIYDSSIGSSTLDTTYILGYIVEDSSILNSSIVNTPIANCYINPSKIENCDVSTSTIVSSTLQWGSVLYSLIQDSSFKDLTVSNLAPPILSKSYDFNGSLGDCQVEPSTWADNYNAGFLILDGSGYLKPQFTSPENFTISIEVLMGSWASGDRVIFSLQDTSTVSFDNGPTVFVEDNGDLKVRVKYSGNTISSGLLGNIDDSSVHFLSLTYLDNSGSWELYLDDMSSPVWTGSGYVAEIEGLPFNSIGALYGETTPNFAFVGEIRNFSVYENVLNPEQLEELKNSGLVSYTDASISGSYFQGSIIEYVNIQGSYAKDSSISKSNVYDSELYDVNVDSTYIERSSVSGDSSTSYLDNVDLSDSSISNAWITDSSVNTSYIKDSSVSGVEGDNNIFDTCSVDDASLSSTDILASSLTSIWGRDLYVNRSDVSTSILYDISTNYSYFYDGTIYNSYLEDSSIYSSVLSEVFTEGIVIGQSEVSNSLMKETFFGEAEISDSSIFGGSIINNDSSISNSFIDNSWTNVYRLTVNASLGLYQYVTIEEDPSLNLDRIFIKESEIWDSSINTATLTDCSIYRCNLGSDVSLYGCTIYNTVLDPSNYVDGFDTNRIVMVDPSIQNIVEITYDSSTFYKKYRKKLDVGMNGCSTSNTMSAGDYLEWVTDNNYWNKFGDMYIWTSAPDGCSSCRNLIDGFYLYNPHTFNVKVEYMLFI